MNEKRLITTTQRLRTPHVNKTTLRSKETRTMVSIGMTSSTTLPIRSATTTQIRVLRTAIVDQATHLLDRAITQEREEHVLQTVLVQNRVADVPAEDPGVENNSERYA